jgi:folate-binding protein YgfZ
MAVSDGNPLSDQRSLLAGSAVVDLSDRGVISVSGPDRLGWLDSLLSQRLDRLVPGASAEALLLDPHGHVEHAMRIVDDGETSWLLVDEGVHVSGKGEAPRVEALAAWLDRMRFMKQVEVVDRSAELAAVGFFGPIPDVLAEVALAPTGVAVIWHDSWSQVAEGGWQYALAGAAGAAGSPSASHPSADWNYAEVVVPREALAGLRAGSALTFARSEALEALRIAAWRPRIATEKDEHLLPHELDWLRSSVHLNKGCYRGQETVAKVHNLGHPPRRLVFLDLDGVEVELPKGGAPITLEGADITAEPSPIIGHITAAARHYQDGGIALGVIKRSVPTDAQLAVHIGTTVVPASQVVIVPPEAGREANVPRLPRLNRIVRNG